MTNTYEIYDLLQDYAVTPSPVREVLIGLVWTYCEAETVGLAMSPGISTRTLPWAGTLRGKSVAELAVWVREFDPYRATVGMAAVNAAINGLQLPAPGLSLSLQSESGNNLAVFEHFLPEIKGRRVVVIGRYPGLDRFAEQHGLNLTVLERQPGQGDLPDTACEYLLPEAEWVFITASSIPNKTFPRLAALSANAVSVLMGPTTPWLPDLYHFGIDYLAGVEVSDREALRQTVAEGGGVRIFETGLRYRIAALTPATAEAWTRQLIECTVREREKLKQDMAAWYDAENSARFPGYDRLEAADIRLSRLDTCFKRFQDASHRAPGS
ncbi:DUF364 domain-containing protein [Methylocaldum szegediense]|uniref:Uncharacterized protein n=1 Tax=Methylocaldum szegediense TaxID=73780 RepID=A0ABN8WZM1_9GAMM|nr:DUF364 domain-containing protein [Methylocaldum szegediense]CAI8718603.1 conserved protein of unknown function [Methylocaldum szegediense]